MKAQAAAYPTMTREAFLAWFSRQRNVVLAGHDYVLLPCRCGDLNCRGWRFVAGVDA